MKPKFTSNRPYSNTNTNYHTLTHISPQNKDITVKVFCSLLSVCVFMCAYYVYMNEDHVLFHLTLLAFIYQRRAPLQSLYIHSLWTVPCVFEGRPPNSKALTKWTQQHTLYVTEHIVLYLYLCQSQYLCHCICSFISEMFLIEKSVLLNFLWFLHHSKCALGHKVLSVCEMFQQLLSLSAHSPSCHSDNIYYHSFTPWNTKRD